MAAYLLAITSLSLYKILVTAGAGESEKVESSSICVRHVINSEEVQQKWYNRGGGYQVKTTHIKNLAICIVQTTHFHIQA